MHDICGGICHHILIQGHSSTDDIPEQPDLAYHRGFLIVFWAAECENEKMKFLTIIQ